MELGWSVGVWGKVDESSFPMRSNEVTRGDEGVGVLIVDIVTFVRRDVG